MRFPAEATQDERKAELRALIEALGFSQQGFADYLTIIGEPTTRKRVESWLAPAGSADSRRCPGWVLILARNRTRSRPPWTEGEKAFIQLNVGDNTYEELSRVLNRQAPAVRAIALEMGVRKHRPWSETEVSYLKAHFDDTPMKQIAVALERSYAQCYAYASYLGLKRTPSRRRRSA